MRLALGSAQFGQSYGVANRSGPIRRVAAREMLALAAENGIDTIDTAADYGESESCLGKAGVRSFRLVTKLSATPDACIDVDAWVRAQVAASLARLNVDSVYGLLLHCPEQLLNPGGSRLFQAMTALKDAGKVQKIGVSIYAPAELEMLAPRFRFDLVQAPFNLIDRRLHTSGWLRRLNDDGVEIHTRSAFLQGLLLMQPDSIPAEFSRWSGVWGRWHQWLARHRVSAVDTCVAFPLSFNEIDRVVVGADNVIQLEQILDAVNRELKHCPPEIDCDAEDLMNPSRWRRA